MSSPARARARPDLRHESVYEILRDGGSIRIRAIRSDDKRRLLDHFSALSDESRYRRFLGAKSRLTERDLARLTEVDFLRNVGLVASLGIEEEERIIGVGRYAATDEGEGPPESAEVAFAVLDEHQGRGVGTLLLEYLAEIARENGVTTLEADTLGDNRAMLEVFAKSGFTLQRTRAYGVVHVSFPTDETAAFRDARRKRERLAASESIRRLLEPRSVAIVGASERPDSIGGALVRNLLAAGFQGSLHPVNPKLTSVAGLECHPTIEAIGSPVDLVVIAVRAHRVEEVLRSSVRAGVRAAVVISAGFAEGSAEGRERQARLREIARSGGMRLVGPNCLGILNTAPEVRLNATFSPVAPVEGTIALSSQSGALGLMLLDAARSRGIGLSSFVSIGNKADVSSNDLISFWADDPRTRVIALYLESFGNPRKFGWLAREVARRKPIVAVKSGRSAAGVRAAASHSAALASLEVAVDALFEQAGVIRCEEIEQMLDLLTLLSSGPVPEGSRVGVVTNAGGLGIVFADTCEARGLTLPEPSEETRAELAELLPAEAGLANPIDLLAVAGPDAYERALAALGRDPRIDALVAIHIPVRGTEPDAIAAGIARGAASAPDGKPVLTVLASSTPVPAVLHEGARGRLPCYAYPENAALALAAAARYARWRRRPLGTVCSLGRDAEAAIRGVVERETEAGEAGRRWLPAPAVDALLRAAGIPVVPAITSPIGDAPEAARSLGFPVVVKAVAPGLVHRTDVGGVIVGPESPDDVAEACATLAERLGGHGLALDAVMIQPRVAGVVEALVGVTRDPTFGPLVACGMGGVLVEALRDVRFGLTPLSDVDVSAMIDGLRGRALLEGFRGAPEADRAALEDVVLRISALVDVVPELVELDMNPVMVLPAGQGVVVVDARARVGD